MDSATRRRVEAITGAPAGELFVKTHAGPPRGMYAAEVAGLERLRSAGALRIPRVIAHGEEEGGAPAFLALELITPAPRAKSHDDDLGRGLAKIHRVTQATFGLEPDGPATPRGAGDNFIATLPQDNTASASWPEFYRARRLEPLLARAVDRGLVPNATRRRFDDLFARLPELARSAEPPALLHGDLWGGNAIVDDRGAPCLIDPSIYFGHREIDLAMMRLFGGFGDRVFRAYDEAYPLEPGVSARVSLYQLYPVLVHVCLFGGGYVGQLSRALDESLR